MTEVRSTVKNEGLHSGMKYAACTPWSIFSKYHVAKLHVNSFPFFHLALQEHLLMTFIERRAHCTGIYWSLIYHSSCYATDGKIKNVPYVCHHLLHCFISYCTDKWLPRCLQFTPAASLLEYIFLTERQKREANKQNLFGNGREKLFEWKLLLFRKLPVCLQASIT